MIGRSDSAHVGSIASSVVRGAFVSVATAFAGAAGVIASCWALQAAALPPPKPAARVAADASVWFHEYRLAGDVFHFDHRRLKGACLRGWVMSHNGDKTRASLLSFKAGPILRVSGKSRVSVVAVPQRRHWFPPARLAAAAGCTHLLAHVLVAAAEGGGRLSTERAYAANRPALALELDRGRNGRLTLYVSPRTDRPLVAIVGRDREQITARIYLQRVARHVLQQFRILHRVGPEPKR
jgi:hypothetical protein